MPFTVKNIVNYPVIVFSTKILPNQKLDLLTVASAAEVKASTLNGVLYDFFMGRALAIVNPLDYKELSYTEAEFSRLVSAGFYKGLLGTEHLIHPFKFNDDGYLVVGGPVSGGIATETTLLSALAKLTELLAKLSDPATATAQAAQLAAQAQPTMYTAVTPSDATDLTMLATKGLIVGVAGTLAVRLVGAPATTVTFAALPGYYPGSFTRVMAATTASGIVACS